MNAKRHINPIVNRPVKAIPDRSPKNNPAPHSNSLHVGSAHGAARGHSASQTCQHRAPTHSIPVGATDWPCNDKINLASPNENNAARLSSLKTYYWHQEEVVLRRIRRVLVNLAMHHEPYKPEVPPSDSEPDRQTEKELAPADRRPPGLESESENGARERHGIKLCMYALDAFRKVNDRKRILGEASEYGAFTREIKDYKGSVAGNADPSDLETIHWMDPPLKVFAPVGHGQINTS
ncbi:hypothetical protein BJV78DRAFT_1157350 [Lactifluus subvellereus]|nr:hypothetical protein BJV78DRAFT_1157350 [Lactifluus subvellereus]